MADFKTDPDVTDSAPSLLALTAFPPLSCLFLLMRVSLSYCLHKIQKDSKELLLLKIYFWKRKGPQGTQRLLRPVQHVLGQLRGFILIV